MFLTKSYTKYTCAAFTLLEVMIAASILAIIAVSVIGVLLDDANLNRIRQEKRFALLAAQEKMENLLLWTLALYLAKMEPNLM